MKNAIKHKLSAAAQSLCFTFGISPKLATRAKVARVLMFHGIGDEEHPTELLEEKLVFLKKHFKIVSLEHLLTKIKSGDALTNEVVLTFDDGLKNNAVHAYPVLKKHAVHATFYVCPGLIESGSWLWNHEARERLRSLPAVKLEELALEWGCDNDLEGMVTWLKSLNIKARGDAESVIRENTPAFTPSAKQRNAYDMMTWTDLKNLDDSLITVGSHTTNHVIAKDLTDEELKVEVVQSKALLEKQLDRPIQHFCYPNGDFDPATINAVKRIYQSAVTTDVGLVQPKDDQHLLNRIPSESSLSHFAWQLIL